MVCFVHDRQFLSKFHAAINQLRQTNEFTVLTLRQLPKRCCSCPEKRNDIASTTVEPLLTSMDIDALRLICLRIDLKQYVATNALSPPSKIHDYTVLSLFTVFTREKQDAISNQFIVQQDKQLRILQQMHHVQLEFVTSNTSEELLNEVVQLKCDLVAKCSTYLEAIQAINGLWVIISAKDQSRVDIVKHALQQQWMRFIRNIDMYCTYTVYNWRQNLPSQVKNNKCLSLQRSKIKYQKMLKKQEAKRQAIQAKQAAQRQAMQIIQTREEEAWKESEHETDDAIECSVEEDLVMTHQRWKFLLNRFQNSNKDRRPRTHRRQHTLALAMAA